MLGGAPTGREVNARLRGIKFQHRPMVSTLALSYLGVRMRVTVASPRAECCACASRLWARAQRRGNQRPQRGKPPSGHRSEATPGNGPRRSFSHFALDASLCKTRRSPRTLVLNAQMIALVHCETGVVDSVLTHEKPALVESVTKVWKLWDSDFIRAMGGRGVLS